MTDDVPRNALYEKRKLSLTELNRPFDSTEVEKLVLGNLNNYYVVPPDKISDITKYIHDNVKIDDAIDPFFITRLEVDLRMNKIVDLKKNAMIHPTNQIERRFVHRITMIEDNHGWKILSFNKSYIANY